MRRCLTALGIVLAVLVGRPAAAQTPAAGQADQGVRSTLLIERAEVHVYRAEIQPGAIRRVHAHDEVVYHLWIPIEGHLEFTMGSDAPVAAAAGQAFFLKRGTPHGFRNVGTTPAAVFEIFIRQTTTASNQDPLGALALELAAFRDLNHLPR